MEIAAPCVVSLTWRLADAQGAEIDELSEPLEFFFGGDDLLAKVEEALAGQEAGFATTIQIATTAGKTTIAPTPSIATNRPVGWRAAR